MRNSVFYIIFSFFLIPIHSQVLSVDRENGQDSIKRKVAFSYNVSFSSDRQKKNLLEFSNQTELDVFLKRDKIIILLGQTDASFNGKAILENNGYFQFRLRDNDKRRVAPDYFAQDQWNGVLGLQNRGLAGCNARFKFWDDKTDDLYMSIGAFYEVDKWNPNLSSFDWDSIELTNVIRKIPRLNFSAKTAVQLKKGIDLSASTFVQFPMNEKFQHFLYPRWFIDMNLFFEINRHLEMNIHYDHNFDTYRPLPIESYYYNLNLGFQFKW
jgi:hypothetical protein